MREEGAPLAGEMSGHMFFAEGFWGHDDGIYGSARLAAILARWGGPLSRHVAGLPHYENSPEIRVACSDEAKFRVVRDLAEEFARTHEVLTLDGARVRFEDGWGLVRASNTQPVLVLRFEGRTRAALRTVETAFRAALARHPEVRMSEEGETG
jgi:phosphomannomutase / phosphoglucomutase